MNKIVGLENTVLFFTSHLVKCASQFGNHDRFVKILTNHLFGAAHLCSQ